MPIFDIKDFSGGVNNFVDPAQIPRNQSQNTENAIINEGNLESIKGLLQLNPIIYTEPNDVNNHNGLPNRSVVSFINNDYWSTDDAVAAPYYGGDPVDRIGVPFPSAPPTLALNGVGVLTGDYKYCVTFESDDGYESAPGGALDGYFSVITTASNQVDVTVEAFPAPYISKAYIYRTEANGSDFYRVTSVVAAGVYTDNLPDDQLLLGIPLSTVGDLPPPDGGKYLSESDNTFFLAVGTRLYYSKQGNINAWNPLDWVDIGDEITGLADAFDGILAFTSNTTSRVTGFDVLTIAKQIIPSNQGCKNNRTISKLDDVPIWESNDGICIWNGSDIILITHGQYKINFESTHASTYDDAYYLFHADGGVKYDKRSGGAFTNLSDFVGEDFNIYSWYDGADDALYMWDGVDKVFQFEAGDPTQLEYTSPHVDGGTTEKDYRRVWLRNDADVDFTFTLEGVNVFNATINPGERFFYLPAGMVGRYADMTMTCTGTIFDATLEYEEVLL